MADGFHQLGAKLCADGEVWLMLITSNVENIGKLEDEHLFIIELVSINARSVYC